MMIVKNDRPSQIISPTAKSGKNLIGLDLSGNKIVPQVCPV